MTGKQWGLDQRHVRKGRAGVTGSTSERFELKCSQMYMKKKEMRTGEQLTQPFTCKSQSRRTSTFGPKSRRQQANLFTTWAIKLTYFQQEANSKSSFAQFTHTHRSGVKQFNPI